MSQSIRLPGKQSGLFDDPLGLLFNHFLRLDFIRLVKKPIQDTGTARIESESDSGSHPVEILTRFHPQDVSRLKDRTGQGLKANRMKGVFPFDIGSILIHIKDTDIISRVHHIVIPVIRGCTVIIATSEKGRHPLVGSDIQILGQDSVMLGQSLLVHPHNVTLDTAIVQSSPLAVLEQPGRRMLMQQNGKLTKLDSLDEDITFASISQQRGSTMREPDCLTTIIDIIQDAPRENTK